MKGRAQDVNTKIPFTIRRKGQQMRLDKASFVLNLKGKALKITLKTLFFVQGIFR